MIEDFPDVRSGAARFRAPASARRPLVSWPLVVSAGTALAQSVLTAFSGDRSRGDSCRGRSRRSFDFDVWGFRFLAL